MLLSEKGPQFLEGTVLVQETSGQSESGLISRPDQGDSDNQAFDCPECGKSFGAQKSVEAHMLRSHRIKPSSLGGRTATEKVAKDDEEAEGLVGDFQKETKTCNSALALSRSQARLRNLNPNSYKELYGTQPGQSEVGPASKLIDLEIIRQLRDMRQAEEHRNNGGGVEATETLNLRKEVTDLKEALRQKDLQNLRDENAKINEELKEIRSEMRTLPNSGSDLAALVKSTENIIIKAVESEGPIRRYLLPDENFIRKPKDAPALQAAVGNGTVLSELRSRGLVTKIIQKEGS